MIHAYWWKRVSNFGDTLNPYLLRKLSGQEVRWSQSAEKPVLTAIGSVVQTAKPGWVLWGSGCISEQASVQDKLTFHAVRGPLTQERIRQIGYPDCLPQGDPALLLPLLFQKKRGEPVFDWGILPHFIDYPLLRAAGFFQAAKGAWGGGVTRQPFLLISPHRPVSAVVRAVLRCRKIAASSLHGLIVADAFGIPNVWFYTPSNYLKRFCLRWTTFVHSHFKYFDYFGSVGRLAVSPVAVGCRIPWEALEDQVARWAPIRWDPGPLLDAFPAKSSSWGQLSKRATAYYRALGGQ